MSTFLSRLGRFSAGHRLVVVGVWLAVFAGLAGILGVNGSGESAPETIPGSRASQALEVMNREFPSTEAPAGGTLQLVFAPADATVTDPTVTAGIQDVLTEAASLPGVQTVSDPFDPAQPFVSPDGSVAVATLTYGDLSEDGQVTSYDAALALQESAPADLGVELGGNLVPLGAESGPGEVVGVLVAFLVLVLTFGSMRAAGANLLVAVFGVGVGLVGVLAYGSITPIGENSIILASMLGLAVGIDYSLFILSRFRTELRSGRSVEDSIARATGTAGTAVVFAGLTVIVALAALMVAGIGFITEMGMAGAFGVLVAVLLSLTLLPVLMKTLGVKALSKKHRRALAAGVLVDEDATPTRGFVRRWGQAVVRRPVISLVSGVVVLLVVALPMLSMKTAFNVPGGTDPESTERTAYTVVLDAFGGVQSPLIVLAEGDDVASSTAALEDQLAQMPGVGQVIPAEVSADGQTARITVIPTGGPIDDSTEDLVHQLREDGDSISGIHVEVTGETAIGIDQDAALADALVKYLVVIVLISLALLVLLFRSLLIPLVATLGFLLSVGASFGASVAVFQWGWLPALVNAPQGDPMLSLLPILLVGVLFGLAMDYQVFLVSRIKEMHDRGLSPKDAVVEGFSRSAPVLVAAATIMTVVFAGFATSTFSVAASIAFGLMVGVLADAFVVRLVLMPALLSLMGKSAWWIPRWLDRVLPHVDVEGHAVDQAPVLVTDDDTSDHDARQVTHA
ncbi:predicted RND superfamily drug exporter [Sanguibacter keddieii DSM 10542]|uniref:Predicted RND superfamily drug exporter n=1 Tax=Sanguibacter keddieii (strain ATCC 51767 / DSM 10542 / NCFB 3025 / ST-74) TaxID=446469 RepID=D1BAU3_SANKS|nr:MMPL family transporter [Sanguibacter keddieii]ACZ22644.1 predicted RND superfamily drug exporter [Sanguibacter keddieii DSM 10542]